MPTVNATENMIRTCSGLEVLVICYSVDKNEHQLMNYNIFPNPMNPQQIALEVQRGAERAGHAYRSFSQGTPIPSSVTESDGFGEGPLYTWPDIIPDGLYVSQLKIKTKANEIDLCSSSTVASATPNPFDYAEDSPSKTPGGQPKVPNGPMGPMRLLAVSYTSYLLKGTDLSKGSSRPKKPVYSSIPLPCAKILFDITSFKWQSLKKIIWSLASEIDPTDDELKGNAAILKAANASNQVLIMGYIAKHTTYAKGLKKVLDSDQTLESFYQAVEASPGTDAGFTIIMENPTKAAQEAADSLTKKQGRLQAQNHIDNVPTSTSALARLAPVDCNKEQLTALQLHLGSFKNHNHEGWRIFNKDDLSLKMELNFRNLIVWAKELTLTPFNASFHTCLRDYLNFCDLDEEVMDDIESILLANKITRFHRFLFPDVLNAKNIESWGISWGHTMELMTHARRFYIVQVDADEQRRTKGKGRAIFPNSDEI
ncbi:uncharacterized protein MELLADRAFT_109764 [Melampsora larici-populina 98AG31]|uniref:Uncharacterized protein n=1 Tax=Melampsora larici-populina (strain 98AG31 / pathotype 3-4-7) TaxID=747676 RepID=F4RXI9_MELLP|nr:uncharacterized protein MELLADRAFT_109764 [Melampsora larici-populina 98AG31]EGG02973.1 hypothetical protein MELLADRAFT_109764 [Melampsora larici-populina 98AG31]